MIGDIAIPAFIAFTLIIGLLMTFFWGSTYTLKDRLNAFTKRLPSIGHNHQAEAIISYLETHPKLAGTDLLISKGRLLRKMNRWEEASAVFKEALDLEFRRLTINPKKPEILLRIADIYSEMENVEEKNKYLTATLNIYEEKLIRTNSPIELSKLYLARAKLYERIGNFSQLPCKQWL